jgi:hypothetical protein
VKHDFALPWVALSDEGGVYIDDANGNTVCGMIELEGLPPEREFMNAELIIRCVNAHGHALADNIRGTVQKVTREFAPTPK